MTPQDNISDLKYQLFILHRMIEQLPTQIKQPLLEQFEKTVHSISVFTSSMNTEIGILVDDAMLEIKAMEHDLDSTRRERDDLKSRLDDI